MAGLNVRTYYLHSNSYSHYRLALKERKVNSMLEFNEFAEGFFVDISILVPMETGALVKDMDRIEEEVNLILAKLWSGTIETGKLKPEHYNLAQHNLCHLATDLYEIYKDRALQHIMESPSPNVWTLIEDLTEKMLACENHVPELAVK